MAREIAKYKRIVSKINSLESEMKDLRDIDFKAKTDILRMRLNAGESLDKILPSAYAMVREVARRTLGIWAHDEQLLGAIGVHYEKIVEMKTGEGKTLTIVFPAFLRSLEGRGVHVVTANDYLAKRDANWMKRVYQMLGIASAYINANSTEFDRQVAYSSEVTYVTNNEVGFDYLKDNMIYDRSNCKQKELNFAIIDEADSVLIDEAQTPLVISDKARDIEGDKEAFRKVDFVINQLKMGVDFKIDEKEQVVNLTIGGIRKLEQLLGVENLYDNRDGKDYVYFVNQLLKAYHLFKKDRDYVVDNGKVVIVDEFTGRLMENHRFFQGIHQAIETKEGLLVQEESEILASITFQHLFKKYRGMAGLTGTAKTAQQEFRMIYEKEVFVVPTHKPVVREDQVDRFFVNWKDKIKYLAWATQGHYFNKRAVLIGTRSIKKSQDIHLSLLSQNVASNVLNAKHTQREAEVVAGAGQPQTVTVATNMAGRGTDISLEESVKDKGGLVIYGTERHNSRRIDDQLIGRSGRQGDPGMSKFLICADDELIKNYFKKEYLAEIQKYENFENGVENAKMMKILSKAQSRMEGIFFDQRILGYEFDKVLDKYRDSFYRQRRRVLNDSNLKEETLLLIKKEIYRIISRSYRQGGKVVGSKELNSISQELKSLIINNWFKVDLNSDKKYSLKSVREICYAGVLRYYDDFENYISSERMRMIEKIVTLKVLDLLWIDFLRKTESLQEAALINSISKPDFFDEYEVQMHRVYKSMLLSAPRAITLTFFKTVNRIFKSSKKANNK